MADFQKPDPVESPFIGEFKGKAVINIGTGNNKYPWSFGQQKAQAIVDNFEAIKEFAETGTLSQ